MLRVKCQRHSWRLDRAKQEWRIDNEGKELLDEVSEDKLLEMSAIPTDIPLPLPNQEKLARTVIDKADVFDEQERERRKQYEKAYCRKQFLRATLIIGVIVCAFIALYWVAYSTMFCWITTIIG